MNIEQWAIDEPIPYDRNPRKISEEAVNQVANSLSEAGWQQPIVVNKDGQKLKMDRVPVLVADLTKEQEDRYRLRDNKSGEFSMWDIEMLGIDWEAPELEELGFDLGDLGIQIETEEGLTDEDEVPEVPEEPTAKLGDIWKLGDHRLMCGDSTSIDAVEKLMDGEKADMVFTDPPYNIDYKGLTDDHDKIKNDKMSDEDFLQFLTDSVMSCETMYVCCSWQYSHLFKKAMENLDRSPKAMIVWDKVNPAQNLDKYYKQHEIIFYHGKFGGQKTLRGDVWELKRQRNTVHPTMKPIELIEMALIDQGDKKIVYDGFGGSGSTLIACEKTSRKCRMMELDPKYIDVIIKRWEDFTGKKAELLNG